MNHQLIINWCRKIRHYSARGNLLRSLRRFAFDTRVRQTTLETPKGFRSRLTVGKSSVASEGARRPPSFFVLLNNELDQITASITFISL
jgi:hypothetical protein